jgi:murein L,D-transpeptidase YcbB/YkuD
MDALRFNKDICLPIVFVRVFNCCRSAFLGLLFLCCSHTVFASPLPVIIQEILGNNAPELSGQPWYQSAAGEQEQWTCNVYQERQFSPLWVSEEGAGPRARMALAGLEAAGNHGLDPEEYSSIEIASMMAARDVQNLARLDVTLTKAVLRYIHDISHGRSEAHQAFPELFAEAGQQPFDSCVMITHVATRPDLTQYLKSLGPKHRYYKLLQKSLAHYRTLAAAGGWPDIPPGTTLHPGKESVRVPLIRELLFILGDLEHQAEKGLVYDPETEAAAKRFQYRHGLEVDGIIGPNTLAAMNINVKDRIEQIKLNLERWRWKDHDLGQRYVLVNIAGFALKAVTEDLVRLEMPVIVGKLHHETPVFSDRIRYIEFNPFWNITPSIARNEMLVDLRENPTYLAEHHIRIFSNWQSDAVELDPATFDWHLVTRSEMSRFKLRQDPGEWNALGTMKFVFPNRYSVYLHDTPHHELFKKAGRAFSHGCIRVSNPTGLAGFLLGGSEKGWGQEKIEDIVASGKRTVITLPERVPVHITYLTGWHDRAETLHFSPDIYKRDVRLAKALHGRGDVSP